MEPTHPAPPRHAEFTRQWIGARWRAGRSKGQPIIDTNPFNGEVLTRLPGASTDDVNDAYSAAEAAQPAWAAMLPRERGAILRRAADIVQARREEIVDTTIREVGGVRIFAEIIWYFAWSILDAAAHYPARLSGHIFPTDTPGEESLAYRKPLGVIAIISPWNSPINLTMRSLAPALACGNSVVLKPSSETPITGGLLHARIFEEAGLPAGVFNVLVGSSREIGNAVVSHPSAALVSFTGSTDVGRSLFAKSGASARIKRLGLELGGNAPFVVLDDADLDQAARALVVSRFLHQGQICMSANRAIVDARVFDDFVERVVARTQALREGDPDDRATIIGPLINATQTAAVVSKIEKAKREGGRAVVEGAVRGIQQNVVPPHVFVDVEPYFALAQEESFGPLLPILKARDEDHALALANDTQFGLSSCVFTADLDRGRRFMLGVRAGMGHVNDVSVADSEYAPFGGEMNSGLGRFNSDWVIDEFTRPHWITVQRGVPQWPF